MAAEGDSMSRSFLLIPLVMAPLALACAGDSAVKDGAAAKVSASRPAPTVVVRDDLFSILEKAGFDGAFALLDPATNTLTHVNAKRCGEGFTPASTFKIPMSLLALERGAVKDVDVVLPWDGQNRMIESWNKDHSMRTAYAASAVWFYQEMARRVGEDAVLRSLVDFHYGNEIAGGRFDEFWLKGELKISPDQQVDFLRRMRDGELPVSKTTLDATLEIMELAKDDHTVLRAKTGWAAPEVGQDVGWFVGMLETDGKPVYFAILLLQTDPETDVFWKSRRELAERMLRELGHEPPKPPVAGK
jgi:beta-lactamase class D